MSRYIKKQFLVLGLGRFGRSVARTLHGKGYEVMAVDVSQEKVNNAVEYTSRVVRADLNDENVLQAIGAGEFDVAVVATGKENETAIMNTMLLKELGVRKVIVKADTEIQKKALYKVGADKVVFPERDTGRRVAMSLIHDNVFDFMEVTENISIAEIAALNQWIGKTIVESDIRRKHDINVIAIKSEGHISMPYEEERVIQYGDVLVVIGTVDAIDRIGRA